MLEARPVTGYTDEELLAACETRLRDLLISCSLRQRRRPPLALNKGLVAILLASGMLDCVVNMPGVEPHVVRDARVKDVTSERIVLTVRAVDATGKIHEFTDNSDDPEPEGKATTNGQADKSELTAGSAGTQGGGAVRPPARVPSGRGKHSSDTADVSNAGALDAARDTAQA